MMRWNSAVLNCVVALVATMAIAAGRAAPPDRKKPKPPSATPTPSAPQQAARQAPQSPADRTTAPAAREKALSRMSPAQQQNLDQLKTDLTSIRAGSGVTEAQKQKLADDVMSAAQGATKPSQASVTKLTSDLQSALGDSSLSYKEKAQLGDDVSAVLNSAGISQSEVEAIIQDAEDILRAANVSQQEIDAVVSDLEAIAAEARKNAP